MSAAIYIAIVAIWACVLIPRWVRRPHLLGGETTETDSGETEETSADQDAPAGRRFGPLRHSRRAAAATQDYESEPVRQERPVVPQARSHVLQARRRLLTMLVTLAVMAGTCTYFKLTHWWVCIPPAAMLGMYLLLLREAARADADRARAWQPRSRRTTPGSPSHSLSPSRRPRSSICRRGLRISSTTSTPTPRCGP